MIKFFKSTRTDLGDERSAEATPPADSQEWRSHRARSEHLNGGEGGATKAAVEAAGVPSASTPAAVGSCCAVGGTRGEGSPRAAGPWGPAPCQATLRARLQNGWRPSYA